MDVYVLVEDRTVLGAGADLAAAEDIADRAQAGGPDAWRSWNGSADGGDGRQWRTRTAPNGSFTYEARQEIVKVPLAGALPWPGLGYSHVAAETEAMMRSPKIVADRIAAIERGPAVEPPAFDMTRMNQAIRELHDRWRGDAKDIRVGDGPAWEWLKAGLDRLTTYPSSAPMPDSRAAAMIWGLPVILDPNVPPDRIHLGDRVFIVGTGENGVPLGEMMMVDLAETRRSVRENVERDLREHIRTGRDDPGFTSRPR